MMYIDFEKLGKYIFEHYEDLVTPEELEIRYKLILDSLVNLTKDLDSPASF